MDLTEILAVWTILRVVVKFIFASRGLVSGLSLTKSFRVSVFLGAAFLLLTATAQAANTRVLLPAEPSSAEASLSESTSASTHPTRAKLSVGIGSQSIQSGPTSGTVAGAEIGGEWSRRIRPELTADLALDLLLETGAMRARYNEEFAPRQIARLRQASLSYQPFDWARIRAGALDQSALGSKLLFQRQSFPAVAERFSYQHRNLSLGLVLEQAVASDTSTRQPWGNWPTGLPAFFIEQIEGRYQWNDMAYVQLAVGHFAYRNFAGPSSFQAQFLGNTVSGTAPADSRFLYSYQGFRGGISAHSPQWNTLSLAAETELVWNEQAPSGQNFGWRARLSPEWRLGDHTQLLFHAEYFRVQPDATLALYQPREFGHTNRQGFLLGVEAKLADPSLAIAAEWIESTPLINKPWQSNMTWLQLSLKTDYDLLK